MQGWHSYEAPKLIPSAEGPLWRGGGPHGEGTVPEHEPPTQKAQKAEGQAKTGIIGSMYPHIAKGMAPGGEKDPHLLVEGALLKINQLMKWKVKKMMKGIQMRKLYQ